MIILVDICNLDIGVSLMYVSPNLSQQIQNRKIELHAELKLCTFIRFKCVLCNWLAVGATLLHFAVE